MDNWEKLAGYQQVFSGLTQVGDVSAHDCALGLYDLISGQEIECLRDTGWRIYRKMPVPKPIHDAPTPQEAVRECHNWGPPEDPAPESEVAEAYRIVCGERNQAYGDPADDYKKTALLWSGLLAGKLKENITPSEAILMMCCVKLSRLMHAPKRDSRVDLHGYALCHEWVTTGKKPNP